MNFYKRFIGDYRSKTARLTPLEHGVYNILLDEHYATEGPLPREKTELFQIVGARTPADEAAVDKILTRYWIEAKSGWTNARAMEEMAAFREKSTKASGAAHKRWASERDANASAGASPTHVERTCNARSRDSQSQTPDTRHQSQKLEPQPEKKDPSARLPTRPDTPFAFEMFKLAYPKRSGAQPWSRAMKAANARIKDGTQFIAMVYGAKRYAAFCDATGKTGTEYVMQAATFLGPEQHYLEPWASPPSKSETLELKNRQHAVDFLERDDK